MPLTYELRRRCATSVSPPGLDVHQQAVVDHRGGPLLVLAGPGTGKTTTLVEAVVRRVEAGELRPEQALVLTFGRRAAADLRTRITRRLARTTAAPAATTFHAFCYAVVRRFSDPEAYAQPLALLSAPEHDVRIREVLAGSAQTGRVDWPPSLRSALGTTGLAAELARLVARAREQRLDPGDVVAAGRATDRAEWVAAGQFMEEYLQVMDAQQTLDYAELVHRAVLLCGDDRVRATLRSQFPLVVVDEYQDTDAAQVAILRTLAGDGGELIAVGDPDQSIYAFRGADVGGLWRFPTDFPRSDGTPAPVLALGATRRFGPRLLAVSRAVLGGTGVQGSVSAEVFERFRRPVCVDPAYGDGEVVVRTFASPTAEAESVADLLRRAHLDDQVPWSAMAVLVRTASRLPRLQRALGAAGVPVEVAGDEVPLRCDAAVQVLLVALRAVDQIARAEGSPGDRPDSPVLDPSTVDQLLRGPLGGLDASALRRLGRQLRRADREADREADSEADGKGAERSAQPSDLLLAEAMTEPGILRLLPGGDAARALRLAELLSGAAQALRRGDSPEEVLWTLWAGTPWPRRLREAFERGGPAARAATRDLDGLCALFDQAARAEERQQRRGVAGLLDELDAQQIPADSLAGQVVRPDCVRLLTAHRSKGLEWRLVVVAGVQEGEWPDLRRRGSLLDVDRLERGGAVPVPAQTGAALLAEERRLFYVAVTRARERLVVTAVASGSDDGDQPSRFVASLRLPVGTPETRPRRPLSLTAVTAELRCLAETGGTARVRSEAARRLARLAAARHADGRPIAPAASPQRWWGLLDPTESPRPVRRREEPLAISGSALGLVAQCPLRWFLDREAAGAAVSTGAQGFGTVVHALAEAVATGVLGPDPALLRARLDEVWSRLSFAAPWVSSRERDDAAAAVDRFLAWHCAERGRTVVGAEVEFSVEVPVGGETVILRGWMDRVEVASDGRVHVVDLKTGRSCPSGPQVEAHPQLGVYQLAAANGALDKVLDRPAEVGGAELVQLRLPAPRDQGEADGMPRVQRQRPATARPDGALPVQTQLAEVLRAVRAEDFAATPGPACQSCDFQRLCPAQPRGRTLLSPYTDAPAIEEEN